MKAFGSLLIKNCYLASYGSLAYKYILSISGCLFIKFNNAFVFPDPEPPIINILYGIYGYFKLCERNSCTVLNAIPLLPFA